MFALISKNVCKSYGDRHGKTSVLKDFNLTLEHGAFEVLMGPSGSGKSTFLHLAAGLLSADGGSIEISGNEITSFSDSQAAKFRRSHVGVVFQNFNLVSTLTVKENMELPLKLDHKRIDGAKLTALLAQLGLEDKASRLPDELSGGERQRVAIGRALFAEPDVILADEPTGNLDAPSAKGICSLLSAIHRGDGNGAGKMPAILVVTHDPMVAAVADKVHFLKDGAIVSSFATEHDASAVSKHYVETYA